MFSLRKIVKNARQLVHSYKPMSMSSSSPLVDIAVDNDGIAIVTMQRPPVNSLNLELVQKLSESLDELEQSKCKGMILTSSSPTVFCAGLDIMEVYKPDIKRAELFWIALQDVWIKLFGSNFITAAAVNGHAPAGACMLAMSCEHRVMVSGKYTIGLNEANLGLVVLKWFINTMAYTIPQRKAELAITTGTLFSPDEALKVGLIDETATDKADAIEKCRQFIKKFDKIPSLSRAITKQRIREGPLMWMQKNRMQDAREFLEYLVEPQVQQSLEVYIQNMKQRKAAAKNITE